MECIRVCLVSKLIYWHWKLPLTLLGAQSHTNLSNVSLEEFLLAVRAGVSNSETTATRGDRSWKKKVNVLANKIKYVAFIRITDNTSSQKYIYCANLISGHLTLPLRFSKAGAAWGQKKGSKGLALHALYWASSNRYILKLSAALALYITDTKYHSPLLTVYKTNKYILYLKVSVALFHRSGPSLDVRIWRLMTSYDGIYDDSKSKKPFVSWFIQTYFTVVLKCWNLECSYWGGSCNFHSINLLLILLFLVCHVEHYWIITSLVSISWPFLSVVIYYYYYSLLYINYLQYRWWSHDPLCWIRSSTQCELELYGCPPRWQKQVRRHNLPWLPHPKSLH